MCSSDLYAEKGLQPLVMRPKEGLALMNGTAVMTAIACLNYKKAEQISFASTLITALNVLALEGNPSHFDEVLFAQKPHPGQQHIAAQLRDWLNSEVQTTPKFTLARPLFIALCTACDWGV